MADDARGAISDRVTPVLVGRTDALDLVVRRWTEALAGPGHMLLVAGEAGIGKSRLLSELPAVLDDARIVDAATFPSDADAAGAVMLALADGFRRAGLSQTAAELRRRLLEADDPVDAGDAARRRRLRVGDLSEIVLTALAEPLLVRVEDLHWADDLSLEVLERVAVALRSGRGMIIATYRADELAATALGSWRARILAQRFAEELRLARLDLGGTAAVAQALIGAPASLEFVTALHERSDGIPLYIEELLAGGPDGAVPETVVEAVAARAAPLTVAAREVLHAGAVIGRSFDLDLLAAVTGEAAERLDEALSSLVAAQLVVAHDELYVFRHALIGDAVYDTIPPHRKRALHAAVASAAQQAGLSESYVSHHFERARDAPKAFEHAVAGAHFAARVSAHREAAELFARASRTASLDLGLARRASLHAEFAVELAATDDNDGAAENLESAIAAYRELGDELAAARLVPPLMGALHLLGAGLQRRTALAREALRRIDLIEGGGDPRVRAALYAALAAAHMLDRSLDEALDFGRRAVSLLEESNLVARADIDPTLGSVLVFAGRAAEGWAMLERSIAVSSAAGLEAETARGYRMLTSTASMVVEYDQADRFLAEGLAYTAKVERWNDHYYMASHHAHVLWARGQNDEAQAAARSALADGRGITTRITALVVLGYVALDRAEPAAARAALDEALVLAEGMGELQRISPVLWGLAEAALQQGLADSAIDHCERAFINSDRVADAAYLFPFVVTGTRAYLSIRDSGRARDWLTRCTNLLVLRGIAGTLPALDHAMGLIELAEGQTGTARTLLEHASHQWRSLARFWEGTHVLVDLATCASRSRRPAAAARLVELVRSRGSAHFDALADEVALADGGASLLTAREFEVAALVAAGLTNREIAARLVIAPKTASSHVEHILFKLGVGRRAEIATWVARQ